MMSIPSVITSSSNPKVKYITTLLKKSSKRKNEGVYVVEGLRIVLDANPDDIRILFVSDELAESDKKTAEFIDKCNAKGIEVYVVSSKVMKAMSDTVNPQGILAVISRKECKLLLDKDRYLLLEDIQDPGNLGTLFRTAEAAGIDEIILSRDCVDIYNPKTIRSTMGTIYRMPFYQCEDSLEWTETLQRLKAAGVKLYGGALKDATRYDTVDYASRCGIVVGNEGNGITTDTLAVIEKVYIPMEGEIESLNAAVAGSILMYEINRTSNTRKNRSD